MTHAARFPRSGRRSLQAVPPVLPEWLIPRPRLDRLLDDGTVRRLTTVVADPGFGKSTVLAGWAANTRCAWYTLGSADRGLSTLTAGLLDALRLHVPGLPADLDPAADGRGPDADTEELRRAEALAASLAIALDERLRRDLVLVLDDVQELMSGEASARLVEGLVRGAPPRLHVVLASRVDVPFPIERLRAQGQVSSIAGADLAFNVDEVSGVLAAALGPHDAELAADLHGRTGGWPAAVRLAADAMRGVSAGERRAILGRALRSGGAVYDYLAAEVLDREADVVRELLRHVAPLDRFTAALCESLGFEDAARVLASLERRGLFVQAVGEGDGYALHPLVREFVRGAYPLAAGNLREVHARAAAAADTHGDAREVVLQRRLAGDPAALRTALLEHGPTLLAGSDPASVLEAIAALDMHGDPALDALEGEARQMRGDWSGALESYRRVAGKAGSIPAGIAWRMGQIHHLRGELDLALAVYRRGVPAATDPRSAALLHAWWAAACWLRGDVDTCRELAAASEREALDAGDDQALAAVHTVLAMLAALDSDRRANDAHYLRALDHAVRAGDVLQQIRIRTNRGSRLTEEGFYEDALVELDLAIGLADLAGFAAFRALALSNRGEALTYLGRLDEAVAELEAARALCTRLESSMVSYPLWHLGDVYRLRGDYALARASYEEAHAVAERTHDLQGLVPALAGLALVLADEDAVRARSLAERAVGYGPVLAQTRAILALGWVELAAGGREAARDHADHAAEVARARRDRAGLAEALELRVASCPDPAAEANLLEEALAIWGDIHQPIAAARVETALARFGDGTRSAERAERALRVLRDHGARRLAAEAASLAGGSTVPPSVALEIRTLGGFEVIRDGRPIDLVAWQSRKARALLKILASRRGHPVPRDVLIDALWPEEDPAVASRRLSVAMSTVRTVLDPERQHAAHTYVASDRRSVWLVMANVRLDVAAFQVLAAAARPADTADREALLRAEAAYGGDFLEEDAYEEWAVSIREELRADYLEVVRALAALAGREGDRDLAVRSCLRVLEHDAFDEAAHLGLVEAYTAAGRHGEARRAYRVYVGRMAELGVEAAAFPG